MSTTHDPHARMQDLTEGLEYYNSLMNTYLPCAKELLDSTDPFNFDSFIEITKEMVASTESLTKDINGRKEKLSEFKDGKLDEYVDESLGYIDDLRKRILDVQKACLETDKSTQQIPTEERRKVIRGQLDKLNKVELENEFENYIQPETQNDDDESEMGAFVSDLQSVIASVYRRIILETINLVDNELNRGNL